LFSFVSSLYSLEQIHTFKLSQLIHYSKIEKAIIKTFAKTLYIFLNLKGAVQSRNLDLMFTGTRSHQL